MANVVAFDDVRANRTERVVDGNKFAWRTNFMQPEAEDRVSPQAFLAECSGDRVLRTHFHDHDQFQIFVSGGGTNAKHPIAPFQVHFSRKHTPYGPIIANEAGCGFLTLRAQRDPGAQFLPENLDKLKGISGRQPWQHSENVVFPKATGAIAVQPIDAIRDDRGLAAHAISVKPNAEASAPDPSDSNGQVHRRARRQPPLPGQGAQGDHDRLGEAGRRCFQTGCRRRRARSGRAAFPKPELPITVTNPSLADADIDADGEYKVWHCVLCAFVYDEAAGLPEEGIAAGTRWKDVPETWGCPDCSAKKADFDMVEF